MHLVRTDLPAPLSPARAVTWPAGRSRSTAYRAWTAPKCFSRPRTSSRGSVAEGESWVTCATESIVRCPRRCRRARYAAASINYRLSLGDAVGGAHGGGDRLAERGLVDEAVLDHGRGDLGLVDPQRNQERCGLRAARLTRRRRRGVVDERGRRSQAGAKDGRQRDRVLGLEIDGLVHGAALVTGEDVFDAPKAGVLAHGRDLVGGNVVLLENRDDRVREPVVRLDGGVDLRVRGVLVLEDGLSLGVVPAGCYLVTDEGGAVGGLAHRLLRYGIAPDDGVVALGEVDRVRVGVLAAVEREDLRAGDVPRGEAVLEALSDELAHLHVVEAHVVGVGACEDGSVVGDDLDALGRRRRLNRRSGRTVELGHHQDFRALRDVRLGLRNLGCVVALRVVDLELGRAVAGQLEGFRQVRKV